MPIDIASSTSQPPVQPKNVKFPSKKFGKSLRSFNPEWYNTFPWIEYSIRSDAIYCYACRFFSTGTGRAEATFTKIGFSDWKHALGKSGAVTVHDKSLSHKKSIISWKEFTKNVERGTSVVNQIDSLHKQEVKKNRHYMKSICQVLLLCARQELSLRGHDESSQSINKGNFHELLSLLAAHDPIVLERMNGPNNATYTSPEIQNSLLNIMGRMVQDKISKEVRDAVFYSILVDETKDISKVEQLSIVIRYVDVNTKVQERFLTYVSAESLTAESLTAYILDTLANNNLNPKNIVSQGYEGASVMSGRCSGVQTRIQQVVPQAAYIHCNAHCLNLALVDSVKSVKVAAEFFALLAQKLM